MKMLPPYTWRPSRRPGYQLVINKGITIINKQIMDKIKEQKFVSKLK
jgi:hypothetical protein